MAPVRRKPLTPVRKRFEFGGPSGVPSHSQGIISLKGPNDQLNPAKRHYLKKQGWDFKPNKGRYGLWVSPGRTKEINDSNRKRHHEEAAHKKSIHEQLEHGTPYEVPGKGPHAPHPARVNSSAKSPFVKTDKIRMSDPGGMPFGGKSVGQTAAEIRFHKEQRRKRRHKRRYEGTHVTSPWATGPTGNPNDNPGAGTRYPA